MYRGLYCPHTTKNLSSDTIYAEIASDSTGKGLNPIRLPHFLPLSLCACTLTHTHTHTHFRHHLQIQVVTHTSHWLAIKQRFLQPPPWVWLVCQSGWQNSEKHCTYWITVYYGLLWKATEKAMATHSSTLAWKIPWTEEPGGLQSMRSLRVGHDFHFSLSCIGEGNGNPLQCSCLENPRDGGAWWAAVYGVAQSRTRLKWLSSSSST